MVDFLCCYKQTYLESLKNNFQLKGLFILVINFD